MADDFRRHLVLSACALVTLLGGCLVQRHYKVGQQKFASRAEAEREHARQVHQTMLGITPTDSPISSSALMALPALEHIEHHAIKFTGNRGAISRDQIEYIKRTTMNGREAMYTALQRRRIFDEVTLVHNNHPESTPLGKHDFLIYLYNPSPESAQWYIKAPGGESPSPVGMDMGKAIGVPRTMSWLDSIEALAKTRRTVAVQGQVVRRPILPPATGLGRRYAVVIGVSDYRDTRIPALRYAAGDARAFYDWAVSPQGGYAPACVKLLVDRDATAKNLRAALFQWLRDALQEDIVTIFFAGHGSPESPDSPKNLYLLPYDTEYDNIPSTAFPMWDIETALKRHIKAKRVIVIADACHSGGVGQSFDIARRAGRGIKVAPVSSGLEKLSDVQEGVCVITAAGDNQLSQEGKQWGGGHGVFTHYLLKGLKGEADSSRDGKVTLGELTLYVSQEVRRTTKNAQCPTVAGKFDPALIIGGK